MATRASGKRVAVKFLISTVQNKEATIEQKMEAIGLLIEIEKLKIRKPKKTKGKSGLLG